MNNPFQDLPYRPCVGIMLINPECRIWIGDRVQGEGAGEKNHTWQMPQGGIDEGEAPREAACRELEEETGIKNACIITETDEWFRYDLPPELLGSALKGRYRGQIQKWFAMQFLGQDSEINLGAGGNREFGNWRWAELDELTTLIVPFKKDIYEKVVRAFRPVVERMGRSI